jgi:hypothetical protein
MLRKVIQEWGRTGAIVVLVLNLVAVILLLVGLGWKFGGIVSCVLFVFGGGLESVFDLLQHDERCDRAEELDRMDRKQRDKKSENNPTLF